MQFHKFNDSRLELKNESVKGDISTQHRLQGLKQWTLCPRYSWYYCLHTAHVLGSYFSIKWNSGTLVEELRQWLPESRADTDSEKEGSPGSGKDLCSSSGVVPIKTVFVLFLPSIFPIKQEWDWLWRRGLWVYETLKNLWQQFLNSSTSKHWLRPTINRPKPGHLAHTQLGDC